jgi:ribonuclease HI
LANGNNNKHRSFYSLMGLSERNPGAAGVGGVILDSEGNQIIEYSWGLGNNKNNQAEVLVVYMGMQLIQVENHSSPCHW